MHTSAQVGFDPQAERAFLDSLADGYADVSPYSQVKKDIIASLIEEHLGAARGGDGVQLGCANGYETSRLSALLGSLTVVDGSAVFVERQRVAAVAANVSYICSLFEDFHEQSHGRRYDVAFCSYVLEHVFDPRAVLANLRSVLMPGGTAFVVVPNAMALSRQLALAMGLIERLGDLTDNDVRHGHRRVYDLPSVVADVEASGLEVVAVHGVVLKILADFQLNALLAQGFLTPQHIWGLQALARTAGAEHAALADSIFVVARRPRQQVA